MRYVTYDIDGNLTGCYLQDLLPEHEAAHLEIDEDTARNWPSFCITLITDDFGVSVPQLIERTPTPQAPVVPQSVTMRQARLALLAAGKLADVSTAIAALPSPQKEAATIEWEYSQTVERNREFVLLLGPALGLDAAGLDAMFLAASVL